MYGEGQGNGGYNVNPYAYGGHNAQMELEMEQQRRALEYYQQRRASHQPSSGNSRKNNANRRASYQVGHAQQGGLNVDQFDRGRSGSGYGRDKRVPSRSHRSSHNDDAASDAGSDAASANIQPLAVEVPDKESRRQPSRIQSIRELFSPREDWRDELKKPPKQGVKFIMGTVIAVLVFVMVLFSCYGSGIVNIEGVFGDTETVIWKYGYGDFDAEKGRDGLYEDRFTHFYAKDAGGMLLFTIAITFVICIICLYFLCVRYNSNLPLYIKCCNIRFPQRQTMNVLLGVVKQLFWIIVLWYLFTAFYGLLELNYYVSYNCSSGTCYTLIVPNYGWILQIIIVLTLSCCSYIKVRQLDPPLRTETVKLYYPEHESVATSRNPPIDLRKMLRCQDATRSVILNSLITYFMQRSSLLFIGVLTDKSSSLNIVGYFIPIGWFNAGTSNQIEQSKAKGFKAAGTMLGSISIIISWGALFILLFLMRGVTHFKCPKILKSTFLLCTVIFILLWTYGMCSFYYEFGKYWYDENGRQYVTIDEQWSPEKNQIFWCPDWGFVILCANLWNLVLMFLRGYKAL